MSYQRAKAALYALGRGIPSIEKVPRWDKPVHKSPLHGLTLRMAQRARLTQSDLDALSVIHVAGTKGKGSTCHFVESILRSYGYKTGLFCSPHVYEETERIQINGRPILPDTFANNFWYCFDKLSRTKLDANGEMPAWTLIIFIMALRVFKQEQVDVAIVETRIGGEYDITNTFKSPVVCGITSLDIDHIYQLGNTLQEIAWQKAGILKPGVPAYTVAQPGNSMEILKARAHEKNCDLKLVPNLEDYYFGEPINLGIKGDIQKVNASLALQLCKEFLKQDGTAADVTDIKKPKYLHNNRSTRENNLEMAHPFVISPEMKQGLQDCSCPGRSHIINRPGLTYYLDVAHTPRSVQESLTWFRNTSKYEHKGDGVLRIAMVAMAPGREARALMDILLASDTDFDYIAFCPADFEDEAIHKGIVIELENAYNKLLVEKSKQDRIAKACPNGNVAQPNGQPTHPDGDVVHPVVNVAQADRHVNIKEEPDNCKGLKDKCNNPHYGNHMPDLPGPKLVTFYNLKEAIYWVSGGRVSGIPVPDTQSLEIPDDVKNAPHVQVLVTCCFKLVSNVMKTVEPSSVD